MGSLFRFRPLFVWVCWALFKLLRLSFWILLGPGSMGDGCLVSDSGVSCHPRPKKDQSKARSLGRLHFSSSFGVAFEVFALS